MYVMFKLCNYKSIMSVLYILIEKIVKFSNDNTINNFNTVDFKGYLEN